MSDYYAEQVERRKHQDNDGWWWIDTSAGNVPIRRVDLEGPYTEVRIDEILWARALEGDFMAGAL